MAAEYEVHGSCLCGAVRFVLTEPPLVAGYCHCTRCQKRTGTACAASAMVPARGFRFLAGEELVSGWRHPDGGGEKCFCSRCGGHLIVRIPDHPEIVGVRLSAFDSDPGIRPSYHQFTAYAASWEPIPDDGLPRYPERRPS